MSVVLRVRRERADDLLAIRRVHDAAFGDGAGAGTFEARLVDGLRSSSDWIAELSLVAEVDGEAVGHVVSSAGRLEGGGDGLRVVGLGPLGVHPIAQGIGVGSALMYATIGAAQALGVDVVCLLGAPEYYGRFGFVASREIGIAPPDPVWGAHFQALPLTGARASGTFRYAAAFDAG